MQPQLARRECAKNTRSAVRSHSSHQAHQHPTSTPYHPQHHALRSARYHELDSIRPSTEVRRLPSEGQLRSEVPTNLLTQPRSRAQHGDPKLSAIRSCPARDLPSDHCTELIPIPFLLLGPWRPRVQSAWLWRSVRAHCDRFCSAKGPRSQARGGYPKT